MKFLEFGPESPLVYFPIHWQVDQSGIPDGFKSLSDYQDHCIDVMTTHGCMGIVFDGGYAKAFIAYSIGNDVHHCGDILSVDAIIIPKAFREDKHLLRFIGEEINHKAKTNGCHWVSRGRWHDGIFIETTVRRRA